MPARQTSRPQGERLAARAAGHLAVSPSPGPSAPRSARECAPPEREAWVRIPRGRAPPSNQPPTGGRLKEGKTFQPAGQPSRATGRRVERRIVPGRLQTGNGEQQKPHRQPRGRRCTRGPRDRARRSWAQPPRGAACRRGREAAEKRLAPPTSESARRPAEGAVDRPCKMAPPQQAPDEGACSPATCGWQPSARPAVAVCRSEARERIGAAEVEAWVTTPRAQVCGSDPGSGRYSRMCPSPRGKGRGSSP